MTLVTKGLFSLILSENIIESYINGSQNYRKGKLILACGFVSQISIHGDQKDLVNGINASAFIHAEMTANKFYLTEITLNQEGIKQSKCVCQAHGHLHNRCKHIAALLLGLHLLSEQPLVPPKWIQTRKHKVNRMAYPGWKINERIRADLTYEDIVKGFGTPPPRHFNNKLPLLVTDVKGGKKKVIERKEGEEKEEKRIEKEKEEKECEKEKECEIEKKKKKRKTPLVWQDISVVDEPPRKKRHREEITYPSEVSGMSESSKEKWRLEQIYSLNKRT